MDFNKEIKDLEKSLISRQQDGKSLEASPRNWNKIASLVLGIQSSRVLKNIKDRITRYHEKKTDDEEKAKL